MRITDRVTLIDKIGRELQSRFSFSDIDAFLSGFGVKKPEGVSMNSKWVYSKSALSEASNDIILLIAEELDLKTPANANAKVSTPNATPKNTETKNILSDADRLLALRDAIREQFSDGDWHELGLLTGADDVVDSHPRLLRSLFWQDADYPEKILPVLMDIHKRDSGNLDIMEGFVRKRCASVGENISSGRSTGKIITFQPKVFDVPDDEVDPHLVSVMMPFHTGMNPVYAAIKAAANDAGFKCERADDIWQHSAVIQDVFSLLYRSFIVVCDFTGKNANVFYEAGIAHTLGKHVIPITQSDGDIPFDLRHHRHLTYYGNQQGIETMRGVLATRFRTLDSQR